ncbi:cation diffusion facilitator family transporter [Gordonia sp. JH63]|uniref:Cation diffusion facilitator family transporter n=1 Tax=Gordonia hongkongensis TaxID=1701090 RepID=A0AAX3T367_9ACTN|nr:MULTISPECIES: cation diffusion facilitator family transporter [Gordonia]QIK47393.1 cation transporter [Gordonia terrae]OCH80471.1 transporter [Gordonia sp. UCD-TK1]QHD86589.1 cation diffusion facilitator family transporter [Gordonia sp. JH63]WFP23571.1 cation diffusion facilitator family transporter [Gordonia hongkongensis]WGJ84276.1 cation diffusion facilitator family transporter [Gordonia sp. SMJS1]
MTTTRTPRRDLSAFAVLSIVTAIVVIGLKLIAWRVTGSVGLLSDALESTVNLVAAIGAFVALRVAAKPPDRSHNFGHTKAEYLSAVFEGVMIVVAAVVIVATAVDRLLHPEELDEVGMGLAISVGATVVNAVVGWVLIRAGRRHRSLTLEADGRHLMTDVWTTAGVVVGVFLVAVTGWLPLDPLIAIAVAANILVVGGRLVWRSGAGLMDSALPDDLRAAIDAVLARHRADRIDFHDVRTREAGHERFVQLHMLVPGDWSVQRAHDLAETIEDELRAAVDDLTVTLHVEPINDPRAYEDWRLD